MREACFCWKRGNSGTATAAAADILYERVLRIRLSYEQMGAVDPAVQAIGRRRIKPVPGADPPHWGLEEVEMSGVTPQDLAEVDLIRELAHLHRTRHDTFLHGSPDALREHNSRLAALEGEYLRRHPERDVDPARTRAGARGDNTSS